MYGQFGAWQIWQPLARPDLPYFYIPEPLCTSHRCFPAPTAPMRYLCLTHAVNEGFEPRISRIHYAATPELKHLFQSLREVETIALPDWSGAGRDHPQRLGSCVYVMSHEATTTRGHPDFVVY
jgi:hypothetical protein